MVGMVGRRVVWCPTECVVDESRRRRVIALSPNSLLSRRAASLDADVFSASAASSDVTRQWRHTMSDVTHVESVTKLRHLYATKHLRRTNTSFHVN